MQNPEEIKHSIERFSRENKNNPNEDLFNDVNGFDNSQTLLFVYCKQRSYRQISMSLQERQHSMLAQPWAGKT